MTGHDPQLDQAFSQAVAQTKGYQIVAFSEDEKNRYLKGYSIGALVFGYYYFWSMRDRLMFWLSFIGTLTFFPIAFVLAFFARKRAWELRKFQDFNEFKFVQARWDRAGWIGLTVTILLFGLILYYIWFIFSQSSLLSSYDTLNIPEIYQNLNELLGS